MRKPCLLFPNEIYLPPNGDYLCIDTCRRRGWGEVIVCPEIDHPRAVLALLSDRLDEIEVAVPACEEAVLSAGIINSAGQKPGVSLLSARRLAYRAWQREMIQQHAPHLNPRWSYIRNAHMMQGELVLKSPASKLGLGCVYLEDVTQEKLKCAELAARGRAYADEARLADTMSFMMHSIVEERLPGPQIEISAIVNQRGKISRWLNPLLQVWDSHGDRIERYEHYDGDSGPLRQIVRQVVNIFHLRSCGINIETRQGKVIEAHARLGEEIGSRYYELLCGKERIMQVLLDNIYGR